MFFCKHGYWEVYWEEGDYNPKRKWMSYFLDIITNKVVTSKVCGWCGHREYPEDD